MITALLESRVTKGWEELDDGDNLDDNSSSPISSPPFLMHCFSQCV